MSRKKNSDVDVPSPLRVDEEKFTEVIRKMVNCDPVPRKDVEGGTKTFGPIRRKKNPHVGPLVPPTFPAVYQEAEEETQIVSYRAKIRQRKKR